jgi:hypothetical protein
VSDIPKSAIITIAVIALLVLASFTAWSPLFHWLYFQTIYLHMVGWAVTIGSIVAIILLLVFAFPDYGGDSSAGKQLFAATAICLIFAFDIFYAIYADSITKVYIVRDVNVHTITKLQDTNQIRFLPKQVAEKVGQDTFQNSKYALGDLDPTKEESDILWTAPQVPNGIASSFVNQTNGIAIVYPDLTIKTIDQPMKIGEGMHITTNPSWPLWRWKYRTNLPDVFYTKSNPILALLPYVSYKFMFPVQVPYWGGVYVIHPEGKIEDLTPEQAMADPRFKGERLCPEPIARVIAQSWGNRKGLKNAWIQHVDQTEMPSFDGSTNQMPFYLPDASGVYWFVGLEPYGPSNSITELLYIDAHSCEVRDFKFPEGSGMIGPKAALGYIKSAFPTFQWQGGSSSAGNVVVIEPRPTIKLTKLYWMASITTQDFKNIIVTPIVNAATKEVRFFYNYNEVKLFLAGKFNGHDPKEWGQGASTQLSTEPTPAVKTTPGAQPTPSTDLSSVPTNELVRRAQEILDELKRRADEVGNSIIGFFKSLKR